MMVRHFVVRCGSTATRYREFKVFVELTTSPPATLERKQEVADVKLHSKKKVTVLKAGECDKPEIRNFIKEVFFKTEPVAVMCGVAAKKCVSNELLRLVMDRVEENLSFVARCEHKEKGIDLAGIAINGVRPTEWDSEAWRCATREVTCEKERELLLLWQQISRLPPDPAKYFGNSPEIFELEYLSVQPMLQRQGIAREMLFNSFKEASAQGFCFLRMDCTSAFSAALGERSGMSKICEVYYKDLKDSVGKRFEKVEKPHVKAAVMVADLTGM